MTRAPWRVCWMVAAMALPGGTARVRAEDAGGTVRVMSCNVRYGTAPDGENHWDKRREFLAETIRAADPDLLGIQEPLAFQRDYLLAEFPAYACWGVGREDGKEQGEMTILFYRRERWELIEGGHFWLGATPEVAGSMGWDAALPRLATWVKLCDRRDAAARPLLFLNTHFDHRGAVARLESARLLRRRVASLGKGCSVIVTGDFNAGEGSDPYRALFDPLADMPSPLADAYRAAHPVREAAEGTFSGFKAASVTGARIDWIGASRDWRVGSARIDRTARDGRTPSDHFPVVVELER